VASSQAETAQGSLADVAARAAAQVATLDRELAEIDMLVAQARVEAERHELKRAQAVEKIAELPEATPSADVVAAHAQLVTLTRRASVMESQVEVLEGKRKALGRFRDAIAELATDLGSPSRAARSSTTRPAWRSPAVAAEARPTCRRPASPGS
jgi:hypothetical protein